MRGPHNLWRLIRTGATFERTGRDGGGADGASTRRRRCASRRGCSAGRSAGWATRAIRRMPPVHRARSPRLGPPTSSSARLLSTRARRGRRRARGAAARAAGPAAALPAREAPRGRSRRELRPAGRRCLLDFSSPWPPPRIAQVHRARAARHRPGGGGQGAAARHRARLPARRRRLPLRRPHASTCWRPAPGGCARAT